MVRLTKIYTRTGDDGTTGLVDGSRVGKDDPRVEAYGTVDELSSQLGLAAALLEAHPAGRGASNARVAQLIAAIQQDLFDAGSLLAAPLDCEFRLPEITEAHVAALEAALDGLNEDLEALKSFELPGGHPAAAALHVARTVCRRAERGCVGLAEADAPGRRVLTYLNRLSDLLFVMARWVNHVAGAAEPLWQPGGGTVPPEGGTP